MHTNGAVDSDPRSWAQLLYCSACETVAPLDEPAFLCVCGKPWLVRYELDRERGEGWRRRLSARPWTLWRYRELLPLRDFDARIDLGEGGTPLIRLRCEVDHERFLFIKGSLDMVVFSGSFIPRYHVTFSHSPQLLRDAFKPQGMMRGSS